MGAANEIVTRAFTVTFRDREFNDVLTFDVGLAMEGATESLQTQFWNQALPHLRGAGLVTGETWNGDFDGRGKCGSVDLPGGTRYTFKYARNREA